MRRYGHKCYKFFSLFFSLFFLSATQFSLFLSSLVSISLSLHLFLSLFFFFPEKAIPISVSFFLFLRLCASLSLSLSLFFFPWEGDSDLNLYSLIEARQSEPLLADLKLCSSRGGCRSLLIVLHSRRSLLVILHSSLRRSRRWWLVEFGHWLICWVGVLLNILRFFFSFWLRFLDLEFVGGSGDCGCSLWWWL